MTRSNSKFKPKATIATSEISSSSSSPSSSSSSSTTAISKASTATKPNTTTFAANSKKSELPPTKAARFREPETNYSWSR